MGKAKKHTIIAQKTKFKKENVSKTKIAELVGDFEEDNDVQVVMNKDDDIIVDVPIEHSVDFIEYLALQRQSYQGHFFKIRRILCGHRAYPDSMECNR